MLQRELANGGWLFEANDSWLYFQVRPQRCDVLRRRPSIEHPQLDNSLIKIRWQNEAKALPEPYLIARADICAVGEIEPLSYCKTPCSSNPRLLRISLRDV